jgi:hypothetical protein
MNPKKRRKVIHRLPQGKIESRVRSMSQPKVQQRLLELFKMNVKIWNRRFKRNLLYTKVIQLLVCLPIEAYSLQSL